MVGPGVSVCIRTEAVVVGAATAVADGLCTPVVGHKSVEHNGNGNEAEQRSAHTAHTVTKVQQTGSQRRERHGEAEPRQEGTFIGKKHLGLHTDGERNALAGGALEQRLGRHGPRSQAGREPNWPSLSVQPARRHVHLHSHVLPWPAWLPHGALRAQRTVVVVYTQGAVLPHKGCILRKRFLTYIHRGHQSFDVGIRQILTGLVHLVGGHAQARAEGLRGKALRKSTRHAPCVPRSWHARRWATAAPTCVRAHKPHASRHGEP